MLIHAVDAAASVRDIEDAFDEQPLGTGHVAEARTCEDATIDEVRGRLDIAAFSSVTIDLHSWWKPPSTLLCRRRQSTSTRLDSVPPRPK